MSLNYATKADSSLKFNSPKVWRPEAATAKPPDPAPTPAAAAPAVTPNNNFPARSPSNSSIASKAGTQTLPRANSGLFQSLGFDVDDAASDESSGDELDDRFAIPSPRNKPKDTSSSNNKDAPKSDPKAKTIPVEQYNELKALVAEREKERDQAIAAKIDFENNTKQTQKHQLGILRDSFKKQMEEKDRKVEDLELLLMEATSGGGGASETSTAVVSLRLKIEKLEKEKQALEAKLQTNDLQRVNSSFSSLPAALQSHNEASQKELKTLADDKARLEAQLDKARSEIIHLQNEKDFNAKELISMKNEIDKVLNSTKEGAENAQAVNAERKRNFELTERLSDQKKEYDSKMAAYDQKIAALEAKLASETAKLESAKNVGNDDSAKSAQLSAENAKLAAENAKLAAKTSQYMDQLEEFENVKADFERKASEMKLRIEQLTSDKERLAGAQSSRASEIEQLVESERSKNAKLTEELSLLNRDKEEKSAKVASLERDLKDAQEAQAKMKDLYSRQMNESSSSFEGERADLLNDVSELQATVQSLKNAADDKDKLLRDAARNSERLEQLVLQKDLEIREQLDDLAQSKTDTESRKSESEARKSELNGLKKELEDVRREKKVEAERLSEELEAAKKDAERKKGEVEEVKKEVAALKEERRNMSAGSVSERENNERERKEILAQFEKEKAQLSADHEKSIKSQEAKYKKQLEDLEGEKKKVEEGRKKDEEDRKREADEAQLRHKKEVQDLTNNQLKKLAEVEQARTVEREDAERKRKEERDDAERKRKEDRDDTERKRADVESERKAEREKWAAEKAEKEAQRKAEREEAEKLRKDTIDEAEKKRKSEGDAWKKKFDDAVAEAAKDKAQKEKENKKEMEDTQNKHQKEIEKITKEKEDLSAKLAAANASLATANSSLADFKVKLAQVLKMCSSEIKVVKQSLTKLRSQAEENQKGIPNVVQLLAKTISKATVKLDKTSSDAIKKYKKEVTKNKKLYNEIQELKGNIRVYCRVRPMSQDELARNDENVVTFPEENTMLVTNSQTNQKKTFEFERIYSPELKQEAVFRDTEPLITSVVDGYNVCIFAYGQTGSGKTYTMEGTKESPGVNLRALNELFRVAQERASDYKFEITVSVLEIYNETIHDLLVKPKKGNETPLKYEIKQGPNGMYVPDLTSVQVNSAADVLRVMGLGAQNRSTSSTNMNEHSSRSHALLSVVVTTQNIITGAITVGKLTLVDLAGSERVSKSGVTKERMTEAQNINKSLSALGDVISALSQKSQHIPYRNSKLTYLLQDSLGGDSKTLMFVQISPSSDNVGESLCSLNFAARVRSVELGQAKKHVGDANTQEVMKMKAHIKKLEDQIGTGSPPGSPQSDSSPRTVKKKVAAKN